MTIEKIIKALQDARYLFDHGAFTPLAQAEFFASLADMIPPPSPPPEPGMPLPAPYPSHIIPEFPDGISATASVGSPDTMIGDRNVPRNYPPGYTPPSTRRGQ